MTPSVAAKIRQCKEAQADQLFLSHEGLSEIPADVFQLINLRELYLDNNQLSTVSESITKLAKLTRLSLDNNQLSTVPEAITQLNKLVILSLDNNQLSIVPETISKLTKLTQLSLDNNQLSTVPEAITQLSELTRLSLDNNQLSTVPEAITQLSELTRLFLDNNQLSMVPETISKLTKLTRLSLNNNQLSTLPEAISQLIDLREMTLDNNQLRTLPEAITKLTKLTRLSLDNNQLRTVPEAITQLSELTRLSLNNNQLSIVPETISKLTKLTRLSLNNNQLSTLPEATSQLTGLRELYLDNNQLSTLPEAITRLAELAVLSLNNNQLNTVPETISQLTGLRELYLDNNQLSTLPESVIELGELAILSLNNNQLNIVPDGITKLTKLTRLSLNNSQLSIVPEAISQLTKLAVLSLNNNQLSMVPEAITKLPKLTELYLANNQLSTVSEAISQLTDLRELYLDNNQLRTVPDAISQLTRLTRLSLANNQLSTVPKAITKLKNLHTLSVNGNPDLISPPLEIVDAGMGALQKYFDAFGTPDRLYEAKLLLVGEPRAGKTSLKRKLTDPNFILNKNEDSTEGIAITTWKIPVRQSGLDRDFRLNVWDFGGQEIYKTTHQFFLTRRSIYLFAVEARKHEDTSTDIFYYWFNVVRLLGGNSPLLVVHNKCEVPTVYLPMSDYYRDFPNILPGEVRVSCETGHGETIIRLQERIIEIIRSLYAKGQLGMELPATWVAVREQLAQLKDDHISTETYYALCRQHRLDETVANVISRVFHELGAFLHFQDDIRLQDRIFLNHEWVTDAVYRVLDNPQVIKDRGRFSQSALRDIWREDRYRSMRQKLLDLMCKFELCYQLANGDYLAPQLLSGDAPPQLDWRSEQNNLYFVYEYAFMPRGILSRLIVRLHPNIYQNTCWYSGVLFAWGGTRALVREERAKSRIMIKLEGGDRRGLLAIIQREIEEIHASFGSELRVAEKIPCNCATCVTLAEPHFYAYEILQSFLDSGKREVTCEKKPHDSVNIRNLIDAVIPQKREEDESDERQERGSRFGNISGENVHITVVESSQHVAVGEAVEQNFSGVSILQGETMAKQTPNRSVTTKHNNAWINGSFYLAAIASLAALFGWLGNQVPWYVFPVVLIGAILAVGLIGALQLRNDERLSQKNFMELILETYKRLPLLRRSS